MSGETQNTDLKPTIQKTVNLAQQPANPSSQGQQAKQPASQPGRHTTGKPTNNHQACNMLLPSFAKQGWRLVKQPCQSEAKQPTSQLASRPPSRSQPAHQPSQQTTNQPKWVSSQTTNLPITNTSLSKFPFIPVHIPYSTPPQFLLVSTTVARRT